MMGRSEGEILRLYGVARLEGLPISIAARVVQRLTEIRRTQRIRVLRLHVDGLLALFREAGVVQRSRLWRLCARRKSGAKGAVQPKPWIERAAREHLFAVLE
jgi:hypothetical protein